MKQCSKCDQTKCNAALGWLEKHHIRISYHLQFTAPEEESAC